MHTSVYTYIYREKMDTGFQTCISRNVEKQVEIEMYKNHDR